MFDTALRPWLTPEMVTIPFPERERPEVKWWDRACYSVIDRLRRPIIARKIQADLILKLVEAHEAEISRLSDPELKAEADRLRRMLIKDGFAPPLVGRSFALVREATGRKLGMRHRPVQLMGGFAILNGHIAEMRTGEGKTITALLPAITAALAGVPVHIVTVNDYLAQRDAEHLRPVVEALGLTVGLVVHGQERNERRRAYRCNLLYACNKELVFDYLRDRIALGRPSAARLKAVKLSGADPGEPLLRGLHFAIVDEADSVFIDEARTPLIISREQGADMDAELCAAALASARALVQDKDYQVLPAQRSVRLTAGGQERLRRSLADLGGLWKAKRAREELVEQAIAALVLYRRDQHYIVVEDKIQIVDEFTGRTMPDRQWQRGLQQLIEAKESCPLTGRRKTLGQITYQRFFRRYLWLSGMTGTALEVRRELEAVYGLSVVQIPTHKPDMKSDLGLKCHRTAAEKWKDVVAEARRVIALRRPVLIGTRSVEASEHLAELLVQAGLPHVILNARNDRVEAEVIAAAGEPGRITVATNMAGRGTDILLRGDVAAHGGLHVILTEFHESARIDRQLYGRCGRQGDPGSYQAIVSLEDNLFEQFTRRIARALRGARGGAAILPQRLGRMLRFAAQWNAERLNARVRRTTVRRDRDLDKSLAFAPRAE
jgi:preprotein translocase subunit SecA